MAERYPGGVISKTPPTVTGPTGGEGGSASGMWTLDTVLEYEKAGAWPKPVLPRELYAWGLNDNGQLGDNSTSDKSSPVQVGAQIDWSLSSSGMRTNLLIKTNNTMWAWGQNNYGQLGDNNTVYKSSPIQVGALTTWSFPASGRNHSLAIKTDNTLWAWGDSYHGQIGDGTRARYSSPVQIGALTDWSLVESGNTHTVAIRSNNTLWTWGNGASGRLGLGDVVSRSSPVQVGALTDWAKVSAHDGLHTLAVKTNGTLWAWGYANAGRLGNNTTGVNTNNRSSPVQIGALTNWATVSAGGGHSLAIKTDGTLWAWGYNNLGQLGDNSVVSRSSPVQIGSGTTWSQVSASTWQSFFSGFHSISMKNDGTVWTMGRGDNGRLGHNDTNPRSSPTQVGSLTNWMVVSAGGAHNVALTKG